MTGKLSDSIDEVGDLATTGRDWFFLLQNFNRFRILPVAWPNSLQA